MQRAPGVPHSLVFEANASATTRVHRAAGREGLRFFPLPSSLFENRTHGDIIAVGPLLLTIVEQAGALQRISRDTQSSDANETYGRRNTKRSRSGAIELQS